MLRIGVSTACLYPKPVEDALYELALSGIPNVEIFLNTHSELRRTFISSLAELLHRFDISCLSLHPFTSEIEPLMLFSAYQRRVEDFLEYCRHYFAAMQALGATVFVLHGNKTVGDGNTELYFERFLRLAELGETYGVVVAQENVARCTSRSLGFLKQMKEQLGKHARFVLDVKQAVRSQENPMQLLQELGEHIVHVHISDHGAYGDCLPIGSGSFPVRKFLQELAQRSPDCGVVLELYRSSFGSVAELAKSYQVLHTMSRNFG